jgi:hypothetical protein
VIVIGHVYCGNWEMRAASLLFTDMFASRDGISNVPLRHRELRAGYSNACDARSSTTRQ